jgi:hypothetical protein
LSLFQLSPTPVDLSLDDVNGRPITTFFCGGIINVFGPTLSVIASLGEFKPGVTLPLIHLMLNPFVQRACQIGRCAIGSSWQPVRDFFSLELGGCPSLVLPSCLLEEHEAIAIHARWLAGFRGVRDTWRFIKKYPSDPWTRVNESVNFGFERYTIPAIRGEDISELYWKDELADRLPLDEREAHEFARHVLSPQHMEAELSALPWAWQSAIKIQSDAGMACR